MIKKKIAVIATASALSAAMAITAFAAQGTESVPPSQNGEAQVNENMKPGKDPFDKMLEDGTISQETYNAIKAYMEENAPEKPEGMKEGEKPELPENGDGQEHPDLMADLLEAGVITQEEYEAINAARPEKPEGMKDGERPELPENGQFAEPPADGKRPELPENGQFAEPPADGERPELPENGQFAEPPADGERPELPEGMDGQLPEDHNNSSKTA